jgi:predicted acetyltransferase
MTRYADLNVPAIFTQQYGELRFYDRDLVRVLSQWAQGIKSILDRGISFDDNVDARRVSVTSDGIPGTEFSVAHSLGKVPTGYIVYGQDKAGSVYDGATPNTATTLYLKSDAATGLFRLIVF